MSITQWELDPLPRYGPHMPHNCENGWESHTWEFTIEEGQVGITSKECQMCSYGFNNIIEHDLIEMRSIPVDLKFVKEEGYARDDINYWWELTPRRRS